MSVTITQLELENVKRVRAVRIVPKPQGLTVIGGRNAQGKTSVLDGIAYALGGERLRPSQLQRDGSLAPARIDVRLSNGLRVERRGKNAALVVTDPDGTRSGQSLLAPFVEALAISLPKFLAQSGREKANVLLEIIGKKTELAAIDAKIKAAYDERHAQGRIADQKKKYADELPEHAGMPEVPVAAAELVAEAAEVMKRNAERQALRARQKQVAATHEQAVRDRAAAGDDVIACRAALERAEARLAMRRTEEEHARRAVTLAASPVEDDESTADIQRRMDELEATNAKVRENLNKAKAIEDALAAEQLWAEKDATVVQLRDERLALLNGAELPLPELSVNEDSELIYRGFAWDCMSGMEQVKVAVAIVRRLKPECGFVLLDGLEKFDSEQLAEFAEWLETQGLQGIATRVGEGAENTLIIEDGMIVGQTEMEVDAPVETTAEELAY